MFAGCGDGAAPFEAADVADVGGDAFDASDSTPVPQCRPNNDRVIEGSEMQAALGVPVTFSVARHVPVDVAGVLGGDGGLVWDWSAPRAADAIVRTSAQALSQQWYAPEFAGFGDADAMFVVDFDVAGTTQSVLRHTGSALELLGVVSREAEPPGGATLLVYEVPVELYRFPLADGAEWVSVGTVRDGQFGGLPYAGRDTYVTKVDGAGVLELEYLGFDHALRVRTHVTLQPAVGQATSRRQVSFLAECFGEVARATSQPDEPSDDFTQASEVRRLSLE